METHIKEIWKIFKNEKNERFYLFYLDNNQLHAERISKNETESYGEVDIERLIQLLPLLHGKSVIAVHNHPNDKPTPSYPDYVQKERLESFLRLMNATMDDYAIVSIYGYVSFLDSGIHQPRYVNPIAINGEIETIQLPNLLLATSIEQHQKEIKDALSHFTEIIYSPTLQVASNGFNCDFLFSNIDTLESKSIFFCKDEMSNSTLERLHDIKNTIEPNEIYLLHNDEFHPLIMNGFL